MSLDDWVNTLEGQRAHYAAIRARLAAGPKRVAYVTHEIAEPAPVEPQTPAIAVVEVEPIAPADPAEPTPLEIEAACNFQFRDPFGIGKLARGIVIDEAEKAGIQVADILGSRRHKHITLARHQAIYRICIEIPEWTLPRIGRFFDKDHTTILHAFQKVSGQKNRKLPKHLAPRIHRPASIAAASAALCASQGE